MPTSVRLDPKTESSLNRLVKKTGRTKSRVIRDALVALAREAMGVEKRASLYEEISALAGRAAGGPPDLSERTGEKVRRLLQERTRK